MFYIPKPRQFKYQPRFYDPKKERWEELKRKYSETPSGDGVTEEEMAYFEQRVRNLERPERKKLTWKDMFRKREMPKFEYKPRFSTNEQELISETPDNATERVQQYKKEHTKMKRRFDFTGRFQRKQQKVWITVAVVIAVAFVIYRHYGDIVQFLYSIFFGNN